MICPMPNLVLILLQNKKNPVSLVFMEGSRCLNNLQWMQGYCRGANTCTSGHCEYKFLVC